MQDTLYITGIEPLIAPPEISFWPPAPGWYVLAGLLVLGLLFLGFRYRRNYRRNSYRRLALNQLDELSKELGDGPGPHHLMKLNRLLKLTALAVFPRERVASLYGEEWLTFLQESCKGKCSGKVAHLRILELSWIERPPLALDKKEWEEAVAASSCWIKHHLSR